MPQPLARAFDPAAPAIFGTPERTAPVCAVFRLNVPHSDVAVPRHQHHTRLFHSVAERANTLPFMASLFFVIHFQWAFTDFLAHQTPTLQPLDVQRSFTGTRAYQTAITHLPKRSHRNGSMRVERSRTHTPRTIQTIPHRARAQTHARHTPRRNQLTPPSCSDANSSVRMLGAAFLGDVLNEHDRRMGDPLAQAEGKDALRHFHWFHLAGDSKTLRAALGQRGLINLSPTARHTSKHT